VEAARARATRAALLVLADAAMAAWAPLIDPADR
jgi:hypothetical protein